MAIYAQPRPGNPTTATVITKAEIDEISATGQSRWTRDENAKVVDIGDGWSMELGIVHRAKQRVMTVGEAKDALQGAITHDNQTEGYYIISGGGTVFIDGRLLNGRHNTNNPDGGPNGPGCGGGVALGSHKVELKSVAC